MAFKEYKRRPGASVYAIRLDLETDGFDFVKWGARQHCKRGDWIVLNGDDTYTVDADVFTHTYERIGGVEYQKTGSVWAERALSAGRIETKEGSTGYEAGDYVVYNQPNRTDGYAVTSAKFEEMYEAVK
jgi:hypothetical protein